MRRSLTRPLTLLGVPLATMALSWLAAGVALPLGMALAVVGFVVTMLLWFRWGLSALAGLLALASLLVVLALTPFVRASLGLLERFEETRTAVTPGQLVAEPPEVGTPLRIEEATVDHERAVEVRHGGRTCELAPILPLDHRPGEPVEVWAVCCDDPRCDRSLEPTAERVGSPDAPLIERGFARASGEEGLVVGTSPIFVTLEIDRGARTVLGIASSVLPLGLAGYVVALLLGLGGGGGRRARPARSASS